MVNNNPALSHHLFQVTQAQGIRQIPADTLRDNINRIMQAGEGFSDQRHRQITSCKSRIVPDAGLMRQSRLSSLNVIYYSAQLFSLISFSDLAFMIGLLKS